MRQGAGARWVVAAVTVAAIGLATPASSCTPIERAVVSAVSDSPVLGASRMAVERAELERRSVRANWRPQLSAFGRTSAGDREFGRIQTDNSAGIRVGQRIFDFGQSRYEAEAADLAISESRFQYLAEQERTALSTALTYIDAAEADAKIEALDSRLSYVRQRRDRFDTLFELQQIRRSVLAEADGEVARTEADMARLKAERNRALNRLQVVVDGFSGLCRNTTLTTWLAPEVDRARSRAPSDVAASDPELQSRRERAKRLSAEAALAKRARLPVLEVVGTSSYGYDRGTESWDTRNQIGLNVSLPLYTGGRQSAIRGIANADQAIGVFDARETARLLRQDILDARSNLAQLEAEASSRASASASALEEFDASQQEFELSAITYTDLVETRLKYDTALLSELTARHDLLRQRVVLVSLVLGLNRVLDMNR